MRLAEAFRRTCYQIGNDPTLVRWARAWWKYDGIRYIEHDDEWLRRDIRNFLDVVTVEKRDDDGNVRRERVTAKTKTVNDVNHALESAMPMLAGGVPQWTQRMVDDPDPERFVPCANGLLDLVERELVQSTPRLFATMAIGAPWTPDVLPPIHWLTFLESLWENDPDAIRALQQIFGYLLTPDTSQQKLFALIGPGRSGKGTIARILKALLGDDAVVNPTLASLERPFGLAPLVGKILAIIGDARLGGGRDQAQIVERLLSISGEDPLSIDRKNRDPINVRLRTRVLLVSNELPQLYDSSGAIASRFLILRTEKSFYGQEDTALEARLLAELPGIFRWAVEGREDLARTGRFVEPESSKRAKQLLRGISSPVTVFLEERCECGREGNAIFATPGFEVEMGEMYAAYRDWCEKNGREPLNKQKFGAELRNVISGLDEGQRRRVDPTKPGGSKVVRVYEGVRLCST